MIRRRYGLINAYIGKEFLFSFLVAFLFFFFIFFVNHLLLLAEQVLSKRAPIRDVLLLVLYSFPSIVSVSFPFGTLVGALMAVGRFSSDNEIQAFQASGVPLRKLFRPFLVLSILFSLFSFVMNDYFLPLGTINFTRVYMRLIYSSPELELESNSIKRYQDSIMITGAIEGNTINDLIILDKDENKNRRIIYSKKSQLDPHLEQRSVISINLEDVFSQTIPQKDRTEFDYFRSEKMIYNILLKDISTNIANPSASQMSSRDVYTAIREKEAKLSAKETAHRNDIDLQRWGLEQEYRSAWESLREGKSLGRKLAAAQGYADHLVELQRKKILDRSLQVHRIEFNKKFSLPFACFFFVILAFPVGLFARRSGRSVGFGIGLFISILYWGLLFSGQTIGVKNYLNPVLAMWLPNAVIFLSGLFLLFRRIRH